MVSFVSGTGAVLENGLDGDYDTCFTEALTFLIQRRYIQWTHDCNVSCYTEVGMVKSTRNVGLKYTYYPRSSLLGTLNLM